MRANSFPGCIFCLITILVLCSCSTTSPEAVHNNPADQIAEPKEALPTSTTLPATDTSGTPEPSDLPSPTNCPNCWIFPDSEVVFSPTSINFSTADYLSDTSGVLATYEQYLMITGWTSGADIIERVAIENSINPRLLLALVEYQCGAIFSGSDDPDTFNTALGFSDHYRKDLYGQLVRAVYILSEGFYGWQTGTLKEISFPDGSVVQLQPENNAGSVALQYFFSQFHSGISWENTLDPETGFPSIYARMFNTDRKIITSADPLLPDGLSQPKLSLPFESDQTWAYTGGPHPAFEGNGPLAALDFSPPMNEPGCQSSNKWVVASADGLIVRSELGIVVQDLDGDGHEQTGWSVIYLHISDKDRVQAGTFLREGSKIGHPSCEGGRATGTHLHIARKYNGVWISADDFLPFVLDGWKAISGDNSYLGSLIRDDQIIIANPFGAEISHISKDTLQ